jgi:pimeloyl-ACP methyl ester carboxylesterase
MVEGQRNDLQLNNVRLEALHYPARDPSYPSLVFLHEGLGCAAMWRDFPQRLCEQSGCGGLVFSRQGYGSSDSCTLPRPLSYMHEEAQQVLPAVLAAAGINRHIVVGHSDGASIGLIHAGSQSVTGLVGLVSIAPHVFCEALSVRSIRTIGEAYLEGKLQAGLERYHHTNTECAFWGWHQAWLDPAFRDWNITDYLPRITVPQLLIQGRDDEYGTLAQVDAVAVQSGGPVQVEVQDNCGHNPCQDQAEACLEMIGEFVKALLGTGKTNSV